MSPGGPGPCSVLARGQAGSWTSSMSVPKAPLGCTKATVVPREPGRGASSMSAPPPARTESNALAQSSTRYPTWCRPSPRRSRKRATGESGRGRTQQLDVGVGHGDEGLFHTVELDALAVAHTGPVDIAVVGDGGVEVVHGDADVVDLGEQGLGRVRGAGSGHAPCLRNRVIRSSPTRARSSGSSMPRPSSGARHSTPIFPSCRLWCTWYAASPTSSRG